MTRERLHLSALEKAAKSLPLIAAIFILIITIQCSETEAPEPPAYIEIISGNNQHSLHGTKLEQPLVVRASLNNGSPAEDAFIVFEAITGGGSPSQTLVKTNAEGIAMAELQLGAANGTNTVKASLEVNPDKFVIFTAMSADYYCPEAEITPSVSYGTRSHLFLATFMSSIYSPTTANGGIVLIDPFAQNVIGFQEFPTDPFVSVVWDIAFSPRGDLYFSRSESFDEILRVATDGSTELFAMLEDSDGAELATNPSGLVVGCDKMGPFMVGCRDTLLRFEEALYLSGGINNDAVAVDQVTEDIYFISAADLVLLRLPIDSLAAEGPVEIVDSLTTEEASGARGMVWDTDGSIYILVDTDNTKVCLRVDSQGVKSLVYDFFSRGQGDLAGIQRDLAIDINLRLIYTIDTLNNQLLGYNILLPQNGFAPIFTSEDLSTSWFSGERVGLVVLP